MSNLDDMLNKFEKKISSNPKKDIKMEYLKTSYSELDAAFGGGIPKGKITEIYGKPLTGKSKISYHIIAEAQREGECVLFIDAEHSFNPEYASKIGIDLGYMILSEPENGEEALELILECLKEKCIDLIIVDSVPALVSKEEVLDKESFKQLNLIFHLLKKIGQTIVGADTTLLFLNQVRADFNSYGNTITPFNDLFELYATLRVGLKKVKSLKKDNQKIGYLIKAEIEKNKLCDLTSTEFELII